jgi:hypothetical protein
MMRKISEDKDEETTPDDAAAHPRPINTGALAALLLLLINQGLADTPWQWLWLRCCGMYATHQAFKV